MGILGQRVIRKRIPLLLPIRLELAKSTGLNSFALINATFFNQKGDKQKPIGGYADTWMDKVCLANLGRGKMRKVAYFIDYPFYHALKDQRKREFNKVEKTYLRWLFRESQWKDVFLTKNLKEVAELGIVYSVKKPAPYVVQAAILTRYIGEFPETVKFWYECQKYTDGHIAVCMAQTMYPQSNNRFKFTTTATSNSNHQAWSHCDLGPNEIVKIITGEPNFSNLPPMSANQKYYGLANIWNGKRYSVWSDKNIEHQFSFPEIGGELSDESDGWGGRSTRLFKLKDIKSVVKEYLKINKLSRFYHG